MILRDKKKINLQAITKKKKEKQKNIKTVFTYINSENLQLQ